MTSASASGLRVAVFGATGALGREVISVLEERAFPVRELVAVASEASLGAEVEFRGESFAVESSLASFRDLDLVIGCAPGTVSLEMVRSALRAEVACIDCSGVFAGSGEIPLLISDRCAPATVLAAPVIATPPAPVLAWWLALAPLAETAGLQRVVATVLRSAGHVGRAGLEVLSQETVALLSQQTPAAPELFAAPVAFDCLPRTGPPAPSDAAEAETASEADLVRDLQRLAADAEDGSSDPSPPGVAVTVVQVPVFVGDGTAMALQTERALDVAAAAEALDKAPGVEVWREDRVGPSLRDAASSDVAWVGRLRADVSVAHGLQFWLAADGVRLAAVNAVKLAETRLRLH